LITASATLFFLELDFTPDEAARQVEGAINWGRYAEL
jgi:hypothetical protein